MHMICINSGVQPHKSMAIITSWFFFLCVCLCLYYLEESLEESDSLEGGERRKRDVVFQGATLSYGIMRRWRAGMNTYAAKLNIFV